MKKIVLKSKKLNCKPNCFIEMGVDLENNKNIFGVSTEIEINETEYRISGFPKSKYKMVDVFIRVWILKYAISIGTREIEIVKKDRYNFKLLFGLATKIECKY